MRQFPVLALACLATLAGCERASRLDVLGLFTRDRPAAPMLRDPVLQAEGRPLVDQVAAMELATIPGGAILRVTGLPARQGDYDAALVPVAAPPGILAYELRARPAPAPTPVSTPASRALVVATAIPSARLAAAREIRVSGARNARALRR